MWKWNADTVTESAVLPIIFIVIWLAGTMLSIANYSSYVRFNEDVYGRDVVRTHLAFTIIGAGIFLLFSAVCWLWAARYVTSNSERWQKISLGFWGVFLFHDLPLFIIEYHMILCCGWRNPFQGFVYVEQMILFFASGIFAWLSWAWIGAKWMQNTFGSYYTLKTGSERIAVLPHDFMGTGRSLDSPLLPDLGAVPQRVSQPRTMQQLQPMERESSEARLLEMGASSPPYERSPSGDRGGSKPTTYFPASRPVVVERRYI